MDETFINIYIEKMSGKILDLTKLELINATQLEIIQKINAGLNEKIAQLELEIEALKLKVEKKTKKEVNTSENNTF